MCVLTYCFLILWMSVVTLIMVQVQSIRLDTIYLMSAEVYDFGLQFTKTF